MIMEFEYICYDYVDIPTKCNFCPIHKHPKRAITTILNIVFRLIIKQN